MATQFEQGLAVYLINGSAETLELPVEAMTPLARVLHEVVTGPHALEEVKRAVQLIVALDSALASPTAAKRLGSLLVAEPKAIPFLQQLGAIDRTGRLRKFLESEGRATPLVPPPGSGAPSGVKPIDLLVSNADGARTRRPGRKRRGAK